MHSFTASVGVNAHIDSGRPEWENTATLVAEMKYLGATNVRDGTPYDWALPVYVALAKIGVTFDLTQENPVAAALTTIGAVQDVQRADTLAGAAPGSVGSLEGANEYNISSYNLNGLNSNGNLAWGALDDANLQAAVQGDSNLAGAKVVAASTALVSSIPSVAPYVDASNWHAYAGVGQQLATAISQGVAAAQASAPGKPVYITEAGISSSGYGTATWGVTDEATQGIIDLNALLDGYSDGAAKVFLYDLMDDTSLSTQENSFGLFHADGTPKPAATDIGNFMHILADPGTGSVQPGSLAYTLTGQPATGASFLLEKTDGTFELVLWNPGAVVSNGTGDVTPPTSNVTVSFGATQGRVNVYDPVLGTAAVQTAANTSSITVGLSKDPLVIEVPPAAAADTLVLKLSEDAYAGDAQFTASMDGTQLGGPQSVTAAHGAGQTQAFTFNGAFGAGPHRVAVSFINDAYGGPGLDRNLYVDGLQYDGATTAVPDTPLYSNGTSTFQPAQTTAAPVADSLVLMVAEDAWQGNAQFTVQIDGATIGGVQTATASHAAGASQAVTLTGNFGAGAHTVGVTFINDAYAGPGQDRNLYVNGATLDGQASSSGPAALDWNSQANFSFAAPASGTSGQGPDTLVLNLSEDAYAGNAQFLVAVDGNTLGGAQAVTASHAAGQTQAFTFMGSFGAGLHDLAVSFINDAYGGPGQDRNLYVASANLDGTHYASASAPLWSNGTVHFQIGTST